MKNFLLHYAPYLVAVLLLLALTITLGYAQAPGGGGGSPGGPAPGPGAAGVPIDGGASLLLASGVALGLKKLRQRRRK